MELMVFFWWVDELLLLCILLSLSGIQNAIKKNGKLIRKDMETMLKETITDLNDVKKSLKEIEKNTAGS